jgi:hypothetical protein
MRSLPRFTARAAAADDYGKPSRTHRRQKRKWKKSKKALTFLGLSIRLFTAGETSPAGIGTPFRIGVKTPLIAVVFLCPFTMTAALCRAFLIMAGRDRQRLALAAPIRGSSNLLRSATRRLEPMGGGHPYFVLETPR